MPIQMAQKRTRGWSSGRKKKRKGEKVTQGCNHFEVLLFALLPVGGDFVLKHAH